MIEEALKSRNLEIEKIQFIEADCLVRLNRMELRKELNGYKWEEFYIIRDARDGVSFIKSNTRSLWFLSSDELNKLLKDKGIEIENELREDTGINNLQGVTIYGRFK